MSLFSTEIRIWKGFFCNSSISSSPAEGFDDLLKETISESTHKTTAKFLKKY